MAKLFIGQHSKELSGWPIGSCGCSCEDNQDWGIETYYLKGDEVPGVMVDAKTSALFISGLLNAYFNSIDASGQEIENIIKMGTKNEEINIPSPSNPTLPF